MYPLELVTPMKQDLVNAGFEQLITPTDVESVINETNGTLLLVVNSVFGCAAGNCYSGNCATRSQQKSNTTIQEVEFEEVKTK